MMMARSFCHGPKSDDVRAPTLLVAMMGESKGARTNLIATLLPSCGDHGHRQRS